MAYTGKNTHAASARRRISDRKPPATLTRGTMLSDVCLVVVWAASIPGLMWLGAAGGF